MCQYFGLFGHINNSPHIWLINFFHFPLYSARGKLACEIWEHVGTNIQKSNLFGCVWCVYASLERARTRRRIDKCALRLCCLKERKNWMPPLIEFGCAINRVSQRQSVQRRRYKVKSLMRADGCLVKFWLEIWLTERNNFSFQTNKHCWNLRQKYLSSKLEPNKIFVFAQTCKLLSFCWQKCQMLTQCSARIWLKISGPGKVLLVSVKTQIIKFAGDHFSLEQRALIRTGA